MSTEPTAANRSKDDIVPQIIVHPSNVITVNNIINIARHDAAAHSLPPDIVVAIIAKESNFEPLSIRYEPGFYKTYEEKLEAYKRLGPTEARARAFSWGLMQIMGQTARDLGYIGHLGALLDVYTGIEWGCRKLRQCFDKSLGVTEASLLHYNGGADESYGRAVIELSAKYKV